MSGSCSEQTGATRILVVVPVYNHAATLGEAARAVLAVHPHLLVVDDGSTDLPYAETKRPHTEKRSACAETEEGSCALPAPEHPLHGLPARCLRHPVNRGKGAAILTAAREAKRLGMTHIVTLDADGQHSAADLPAFLEAARNDPAALYVGSRDFDTDNVPRSSRFGRAFSNFWYKVHTGESTEDVQSGFRLYPLALLDAVRCSETRYSFEVEVLVRASWAGFAVKNLPISVSYPEKERRVSHFKPLADNVRISLLNTRLTIRAIAPIPQKKYVRGEDGRITVLHPMRSLRRLLADNATPKNLALAAALGMGIGALPLIGLHSILIILGCGALRLNKITGLAVSQLCIPPFVPALCIEAGHSMRHGRLLTEISLRTLGYEAPARLLEWVLGSLVLAPLFALLCGGLVWLLAASLQKSLTSERGAAPLSPPAAGEKL